LSSRFRTFFAKICYTFKSKCHRFVASVTENLVAASSFVISGQENAGKKEPKKSEKIIGDVPIKQKVKVVKALKTRDPNVSNEQDIVGVAAYEEEVEEGSDCGVSVVSDSPIFKFAPRPQSSIKGELLVGMTACLYKAFEHADQEGKSSIDVLRNIVTKQVSS
jgi:hypothetical protein